MNIKKVEKAVKKINQLLENIKEENAVSSIERDLLLSYTRDLYEKVLYSERSDAKPSKKVEKTVSYTEPERKVEAPIVEPPVQIADVVRQEIKETTQYTEPKVAPLTHVSEQAPIAAAAVAEIVEEKFIEEGTSPVQEAPQELLDLFAAGSGSELSDKLGRSPIADLTKSMGINERIFTVNELFGGNSELFNTTMASLNKLDSLEQARDYLVTNVAIDQNWASKDKIKKVANFVKLISRRY